MLTEDFHRQVGELLVPAMGTEEVGPLLYHLLRMTRPRRVLEVGMGFTTPFIAQAMAENRRAAHGGGRGLAAKSSARLRAGEALDDTWVRADPALLDPTYHVEPYEPRFVAVDDLQGPGSSAGRVLEVLDRLGLRGEVDVLPETLSRARDRLAPEFARFDFAWLDIWEKIHLFDRYWDLIDPAGGLALLHYLHGYPEGEEFLRQARERQLDQPPDFEILSLVEPHKVRQNSLTLIRRIDGLAPVAPSAADQRRAAQLLVNRFGAAGSGGVAASSR